MRKTRKALNLIALIGFLGSNFLTPLAYAQTDISEEVSWWAESQSINVPLWESGNDEIGEGIPSDEERIPPTPLIKGGNPKDGGIIPLTEGVTFLHNCICIPINLESFRVQI